MDAYYQVAAWATAKAIENPISADYISWVETLLPYFALAVGETLDMEVPDITEVVSNVREVAELLEPVAVPEQPTSVAIGGPEVEAQIAEQTKQLEDLAERQAKELEDRQARLDAIEAGYKKAHEDDSAQKQAADQEKLDAAREASMEALREQHLAEIREAQQRAMLEQPDLQRL